MKAVLISTGKRDPQWVKCLIDSPSRHRNDPIDLPSPTENKSVEAYDSSPETSDCESEVLKRKRIVTRSRKNHDIDEAFMISETKKQNKMKNFPGLMIQNMKAKVIARDQNYLRFIDLVGSEKRDFDNYLSKYNKQAKTWKAIQEFLEINVELGLKALDIVFGFLDNENQDLFDEWVKNGRMNEENKKLVKERKAFFVGRFRELKANLEEKLKRENITTEIIGSITKKVKH